MKTEKRNRASVLDLYEEDMKRLAAIGVTIPNIAKIINDKLPGHMRFSEAGVRSYIKRKGIA
jgi:septation ring formation regulator EzrA